MRVPRYSALVCLLIATGASSVHADVELQPKERENLGIQVETVTLVDAARTWPAAASVIDVSGLVTAINELQTAEAAASASRDEARRSSDLYRNDTNVSRKALDAAQSQSIADEGRVTTARAQLLAAWGSPLASMSAPARRQLVDDLLAGRAVLVRAEVLLPMPSGAQITQARLTEINGEENWPATVLGRLPQGAGRDVLRRRAVTRECEFADRAASPGHAHGIAVAHQGPERASGIDRPMARSGVGV
ncbi:MAG: hypothetical protein WDO56_37115 [Gammaproteobacteria bacterium]